MAPHFASIAAETQRLNIPSELKLCPEAGHGFMNKAANPILGFLGGISPIKSRYDPVAAEDARNRVIAFLREHL
jgi:carboxymethylenebutenolidase